MGETAKRKKSVTTCPGLTYNKTQKFDRQIVVCAVANLF